MTAYRSIDGTGNNQNFNATGTDMTREGTVVPLLSLSPAPTR
jgi:hypothetical protein